MSEKTKQRAAAVRLLALDVDGVLSDGRLYYGPQGDCLKTFSTRDGLGLKLLQQHGIKTAIITGRESDMVKRRASELGIDALVQGRDDKLQALQELAASEQLSLDQIAYMGDDLPDLAAIMAAGFGATVADAAAGIAERADFVSQAKGGDGAVREVCEYILSAKGKWGAVMAGFSHTGAGS